MNHGERLQTRVILSVRDRLKTVPYIAETRASGDENFGFMALKNAPDASSLVPEARADRALARVIDRLNAPGIPFFTIGCVSGVTDCGGGVAALGYFEFAFNHTTLCADAQHYFKLFFDFSLHFQRRRFDVPATMNWEIEPVKFMAAGGTIGFGVTVWVQTGAFARESDAQEIWRETVEFVTDFLAGVGPFDLDPIY